MRPRSHPRLTDMKLSWMRSSTILHAAALRLPVSSGITRQPGQPSMDRAPACAVVVPELRFGRISDVARGAGGQRGRLRVAVWTSTSLRSCSAPVASVASSISTSRAVPNDVKHAEVSERRCLRWNGFGGLSI
jgi:hypothetical protein